MSNKPRKDNIQGQNLSWMMPDFPLCLPAGPGGKIEGPIAKPGPLLDKAGLGWNSGRDDEEII